MADETAPSQRTVLGRSKIFTPEVINDIHMKAELGRYRMRGFSMFKKIPHWDELVFLPGTLTRFVIEGYREKCDTKTVLGARFAQKPIELDIPVYITGMSFGALSLEAKMALAKGASMAGTATCSGEGGMIPPERDLSTKWYYQVIQSRYGFNPHHLMLADAAEFFIGQGCKVGLGGHLMGQKVTEQVAEMRSLPAGIDQRSPARHPDWLGPDDLSLKIQEIREATDYQIPIQLKLGAARVYDDVRMAAKCGPDIIYLDGAEGGTGAGPHLATEETGIPLMAAIPEARRALEDVGLADEIDLVVAGGIRNGGDIAKCIALGAKAVAIGHSALMALNCNKEIPGVTDYMGSMGVPAGECYHCHTGRCPVGVATQDPELRKRLVVDDAAQRVFNFLHTLTMEVQLIARACGKTNVHSLEPEDLAALTRRGRGDGEGPAHRHGVHPGRDRGALAGAHRARCSSGTWRTRSTTTSPRRRSPAPTATATGRRWRELARRAREDHLDRRGVPLRQAVPLPGGPLAGRGRRPDGGDPGQGHQLARGHHAARRGRRAGGLRPLLQLVPEDLLRHPRGPGGRARAQGADQAPAVRQLLRDRAQVAAREVPAAGARVVGRGLPDRRHRLEGARARGLGAAAPLSGPMAVTLTQLSAFLSVVRRGSVTAAAEELFVTQPSVSAAVAALEREVGAKLLERDGRGLRPTAAGAAFAPYAAHVLGLLEEGGRAARECTEGARATLRISAVTSAGDHVVPPLIRAFCDRHPELDIDLHIGNRSEVFAGLLEHRADVAITGRVPEDERLRGEAFGVNEIVLVTAPDDPLARRRWVAVEELGGRPWLLREPARARARWRRSGCARAGWCRPSSRWARTPRCARPRAPGSGIGLVSRTSAALELKAGLLGAIRPRGGLPQRQWFVVRCTVGPARPAADAFVAFLGSPAARQVLRRVLELR